MQSSDQNSMSTLTQIPTPIRLLAHEFNNCLMIIQSNLDILQASLQNEKITNNKMIQERLMASLNTILQAKALINHYLKQSGGDSDQKQILLLSDILSQWISDIKPLLDHDIDLQVIIKKHTHTILVDPHQLKAVIYNLIINADHAIQSTMANKTAQQTGKIIFNHPVLKLNFLFFNEIIIY